MKLLHYAHIGCTSKRRQHGLSESHRAALHDAEHPRLRYIGVCVDPSYSFRVIDIRGIPKKTKIEQNKNIIQELIHSTVVVWRLLNVGGDNWEFRVIPYRRLRGHLR